MLARVLLPLALVLALVGMASAEKGKLAVLGLEVAGSIDTDSTYHGRLLTERFRAKIGISPRFMLAPNSMKDLLDEKVANGCDNEAPDCMAKIAGKLKAAFLLYGKIEKRPKDGKEGYQLSMKALDVEKRAVAEWGDWVPLADFVEPGALDSRVARAFETLTNVPGAAITGSTNLTQPTAKPKAGRFPWKTTAYVSTAVALATFGGFIYTGPIKTGQLNDECHRDPATGAHVGDNAEKCAKDGPRYSKLSWITGLSAAAVGGFALFAYYQGFVSKKESNNPTSGRSTRKKKQFAVTPIVSPDGAGATFRLDW
jgi:hypothetical protein